MSYPGSKQLADRCREVLLNGTWIANTNFKSNINDLSWIHATTSVHNLNSIALLIFHVNYYIEGINNVFDGGSLDISDRYSFDAQPITCRKDWVDLQQKFEKNAKKFANHVELMDPLILESDFVKSTYGSYRRNIEGVIEHAYYHLGQVSLIKKIVGELDNDQAQFSV